MSNAAQEKLIEYIRTNQSKLYKLAFTYTRNEEMALDVLQEAITKALENINKLRKEEYVNTWFYRILINEAIKSSKKYRSYFELELIENETHVKSDEDKIIANIDMYNIIQSLNDKLKTVIILRFYENMKIEEIAFITKTNISTVKSRLYKAIEEVKVKLNENV